MHLECEKTPKSVIYDCFQSVNAEVDATNTTYIIDGGHLLHHVVWDRAEIFSVIFEKYVRYLRRHYGHRLTVVFDGYGAEQRRRTTKTSSSSDIIFDQFMKVPANLQQFLANIHNKSRFIYMLSDKLITENIAVKQAQNATNTIVVVGEDVDLLILLTARTQLIRLFTF